MRRNVPPLSSFKPNVRSTQPLSPISETGKRTARTVTVVIKSRIAKYISICLIIATLVPFYFIFRHSLHLNELLPHPLINPTTFGDYPNTVVTAYFSIRSKYKTSEYAKWMSTMLSLQDPMVIFCNPDMYDTIRSLRRFALNRTMIITMALDELPLAQKYSLEQWQAQYDQDPEKRRHASYYLFWIWLSKSYFVTRAIEVNPFHSRYFMWSDIGCFRSERDTARWKDQTMMIHSNDVIPSDRMLFLAHHEPNPPPTVWWTAKLKERQYFYHSGTMMAGTIDTWPRFHAAFLLTLEGFFQRNLFVGDDQTVLQCTCLQFPHLCMYITHLKGDNHYFGLRSVLHKGRSKGERYFDTWTPPPLPESKLDTAPARSLSSNSRVLLHSLNSTDTTPSVQPMMASTTTASTTTETASSFPYNLTNIIQPRPILHRSEVTIVTAYFQLPSKFDVSKYDAWMQFMLSLQDSMIIFTSPDLVAKMQSNRVHAINRTVIIPMNLDHVPLAQEYSAEFWRNQLKIDPERKIHRSYQLFWIWLSKSWWVNQAIAHNFFDSRLFVWSDIGCFRNAKYRSQLMVRHPEMIPRHAILQMAHHRPNPPSDLFWNDKYSQRSNFYHSGSQAAGYSDTWQTFHSYFMATFKGFVERNMFVGEDQAVLQSTCRQHPTMCAYVRHKAVIPKDNHYFGLRFVLYFGGNYTYWYHPPLTPEEEKKLAAHVTALNLR